jgi:hypothetical protein
MSWLLPSALGLAAAAIVGAALLHFIARSRPVAEPLPTARFIPQRAVQARTRSRALSDLPLLLLRAAALALIGAAVAGPIVASRGRVARVVIVDRSRAVANLDEARDSVRRIANRADALVAFDSSAVRTTSLAALDTARPSRARGSLSAAIAAGTRAAVLASPEADSVELVIVSPFAREEMDDATLRLRAAWPGRIRIVPVRLAIADTTPLRVDVGSNDQDAVAAGLSLAGVSSVGASIRLVRGFATAADSSWARGRGHVLLHWPASDSGAHWPRRATIDAIGGVMSRGGTLVARFPRPWVLGGDAIAYWSDGEPAAVEHATGDGCIRDVGILVDDASDLTLRPSFRQFVRPLIAPCGGLADFTPMERRLEASLAGSGPLAAGLSLRDRSAESSHWSPWLFALAALVLTGELAMRRPAGRVA